MLVGSIGTGMRLMDVDDACVLMSIGINVSYADLRCAWGGQVARDHFHGAVRRALEKGGWTITADPYLVRFDRTTVEIDLAAEQFLAAEWQQWKIAVEVKSFWSVADI